jgi:hypothetical protein
MSTICIRDKNIIIQRTKIGKGNMIGWFRTNCYGLLLEDPGIDSIGIERIKMPDTSK